VFHVLLESRPTDSSRPRLSGGTLAIIAHVLLIGLAFWVTASRGASPPTHRPRIIQLYPPPPVTPAPPTGGPVRPTAPAATVDLRELSRVPLPDPKVSLSTEVLDPRTPSLPQPVDPSGDARFSAARPLSPEVVDERPELLTGPPLPYPEPLRQAGIGGRVLVRAVIDTLGRAEPASVVVVLSPNRGFDRAALDYVRRALFRPARVLGRPARVLVEVPIEFQITRVR
jgi:TonB family protein